MSMIPRCVVCDDKIDPYGRGGTRCDKCAEEWVETFNPVHHDTDPKTGNARISA